MRSASGLLTAALLVSGTVPAVAAPATPGGYQWGENLCVSGSSRLPQAATGKAMQAIDGGRDHALWLTPEGQVLIQGAAISFSSGGQTGGACYSAPSAVAGLTGVSQVAAGNGFSLALKTDGSVVSWGLNSKGQLGDGTAVTRGEPRPVPGLTGVVDIAAGDDHGLALLGDGTIMAWGANTNGQLGEGTTTPHSTPAPVPGLAGITDIAAGGGHSLAITSTQELRAWGRNADGELGDGTTQSRTQPVAVIDRFGGNLKRVTQVDGGLGVTAAVVANASGTYGSIYTWGAQKDGQLGNGAVLGIQTAPDTIQQRGSASQVAVGLWHSVARMSNGQVYSWGRNSSGQIGNNKTTVVEPRPSQTIGDFATYPASQVAATGNTSLALP